jgi:signal transduction histidine kinase
VAFQCDAIAGDLAGLSPEKADRFTRMRRQVQDYIREARQSIWELRSQRLEGTDLPTALRKLCEQVIADRPVELEFHVRGVVQPCPDRVEQQLMLIGQEALLNAVRHGNARVVRVELEYTRTSLKLRVSDDGRGFDAASVNYEIAGHYGLSTMRERAQDLGGGLTIDSGVGRGTAVEAVVPALRSGRAS